MDRRWGRKGGSRVGEGWEKEARGVGVVEVKRGAEQGSEVGQRCEGKQWAEVRERGQEVGKKGQAEQGGVRQGGRGCGSSVGDVTHVPSPPFQAS